MNGWVSLVSVTPGLPRLASWPSGLWSDIWVLTLLIVLSFGMLLDSGMLMIWPMEWRNTLVSGLTGAGKCIPLVVLRLLVLVYAALPLRRLFGMLFGVRLRSMVMPVWSIAVPSCRCRVLSRLCSVLSSGREGSFWPCRPLGLLIFSVVRSIGRLLDHGRSPAFGERWGQLFSTWSRPRVLILLLFLRWSVMLLRLTSSREGFVWRIGWVMPRLTRPLIWAGAISLNRSRRPGGFCFRPTLTGTPSPLQLHRFMIAVSGFRLTMMVGLGRRLIPLSGTKGVGKSIARWILGLMLILHHFLGHLVSCMGFGFRFMVVVSLVRILLPGLTVLACCASLFPFLGL